MKSAIRVGLLLDSCVVPAWIHALIQRIQASDYATIDLVVLNNQEAGVASFGNKVTESWAQLTSGLLRRVLLRIQNGVMERGGDCAPSAFEMLDARELLETVPEVRVTPRRTKYSDYFPADDVDRIKSFDLDVLVRFGFRILRGDILEVPRYGVWSYHHGDNRLNRGGPPGYWETMESWPETGSLLQILTEDLDGGLVLYRSCSGTDSESIAANRNSLYWKSLSFLPRCLEALHRLGADAFFNEVTYKNRHPVLYSNRLYVSPTSREIATLAWRKLVHKARKSLEARIYDYQWRLYFDLREGMSNSFWRFKEICPPSDRFWADPNVVAADSKYYVFIEEYIYKDRKGHISLLEMDKEGSYKDPVKVVDAPYHMSYPFVFEWDGSFYMIPESYANRTIELYKCRSFPDKWERCMTLMEDVRAVDTTVLFHEGRWWLFTSMIENEGGSPNDELFLFYADQPLTREWQPHCANPVVSDASTARPAGRVLHRDGRLYRPSQNCTPQYGYGFNLSEIVTLNPDHYEEKLVSAVEPKWDKRIFGTHTYCYDQGLTMIDARVRRRKRFLP